MDMKEYIIKQKDETLRLLNSTGLKSWKAVMLYKNYRQHAYIKCQDFTHPEQSKEQWDTFDADTAKNIEKQTLILEQKIWVNKD